MSFLRNLAAFLIYIISLSYALQCTTSCSFSSNLNATFAIPESCDRITSEKFCAFRMSLYQTNYYSSLSFKIVSSNYSFSEYHYARAALSDYGSIDFSYSISHECKHTDDCALEFAKNKMPDILRRLATNYEDIRNELLPLLSSGSSIEDTDLSCFDIKENVRQCAIAKKPSSCQATQQLMGTKKTNRSCSHDLYGSKKSVSISDFGQYASFEIKCNRSLCNGPMTLQAVKEVMFKYNITKTIDGRLNNALRLSLSSTFLILLIIVLFFV
jgi:hypothetical protein